MSTPFDLSQTDHLLKTTRSVRKRLDFNRPAAVLGPVLFLALARLAAICFSVAIVQGLDGLFGYEN